jgi:lipoprotein-releasing system permease protein
MPYELFLALRYLRARRGRRVAQLTALAAVAGVAFGVGALVVALALANGFRDELRDKILRGTAHVTVSRADGGAFADWRGVAERARAVGGVVSAEPTAYEGALLTGPNGASYAVVRGVEEESGRARGEIARTLESGAVEDLFSDDEAGRESRASAGETRKAGGETRADGGTGGDESPAPVVVGAELAARTGLSRVGDEGWLVTGEASATPPGFAPRSRRVRVVGVFRTGLFDYDSAWLYAPLAEAARLAGSQGEGASAMSVEVRDVYAAGEVAARVRGALGPGWSVVDWREANRPLFAALELERRIVALIIALIILVAALNITTTLALVVVERRADIAVLTALGARARSVTLIFVMEGALLGALGALAGVALGLACVAAANYFGLVRLPADVYSISVVPLRAGARDVLWPALAAFAVSVLATLYPARRAARTRPSEVLRHG